MNLSRLCNVLKSKEKWAFKANEKFFKIIEK